MKTLLLHAQLNFLQEIRVSRRHFDLFSYVGNLVRDPSREVRMGLRSLLDPLNKMNLPIYFKQYIGYGIA